MKVIDRRGRILGLISIVDILVILVMLAGVYWFYDRYGAQRQGEVVGERRSIEVLILSKNNDGYIKDSLLRDGRDLKKFNNNQYFGHIEKLEIKNTLTPTRGRQGQSIAAPNPRRFDFFMTVRCEAEVIGREYFVAGRPLKVGDRLELFTSRTFIEGYPIIMKVEK